MSTCILSLLHRSGKRRTQVWFLLGNLSELLSPRSGPCLWKLLTSTARSINLFTIKYICLFCVVPRCAGVCGHMEYPCRFQNPSATTQEIIPHRVFAPESLAGACQETLLQLLSPCLSAAHAVLGTHPFSRLDVLIVPANFPSLGMARYIVPLWHLERTCWGNSVTISCFFWAQSELSFD